MARTVSPSQLFFGRRQRQQLPLTAEQTQAQESLTASRDKAAGKSESYKNRHTLEFTELHSNQQVWMEHHITGKWDTKVTVRWKRTEGNSYVVCAPNRNTYTRGRCFLKPLNSKNHVNEDSNKSQQQERDAENAVTPTPSCYAVKPNRDGRPRNETMLNV